MRWFWQQQEHPYTRDHFRFLLATTPLWLLLLWYVGINLLIAAALGSAYFLLQSSGEMAVWDWFFYSLLQLFAAEPPPEMSFTLNDWQRIVFVVNAVFGLLLPTILLGSIVFRIFVQQELIIFRKKMSLTYRKVHGKYAIGIRAYNSSRLRLVAVNCTIVFRQSYGSSSRGIELENRIREQMSHHSSHGFNLYLEKKDIDPQNQKLKSLRGYQITPGSKIRIVISGKIPALGIEIIQTKVYTIPQDIVWGDWKRGNKMNEIRDQFEEIAYPFTPMPGHIKETNPFQKLFKRVYLSVKKLFGA